ncbi:centrosomal protein of 68 kDa isoform X2 [Betta splendens]|uniref:Centrosomal protein of 68 kDa isoform X2 n=1 Tax=Betta splendens TaxID=158456 RepID=A0A9W2XAK5_BETSP|nr:centrosomal protein of 68 kDa isoform X2 [Betta splendens]
MEAKRCSPRWKPFSNLKYSRRCLSLIPEDNETERDRAASHKSVTMAQISRCVWDRRYVTRKPQLCSDQQTCISDMYHVKKRDPPQHTRESGQSGLSRSQHTDEELLTKSREELPVNGFSFSHRDTSPPSDSTKGHHSPEFINSLGYEGPTLGSCFSSSRSSSIQELQRLKPKVASTHLYLHCIPCPGYSSPEQPQLMLGGTEGRGEKETKLLSHTEHSRRQTMTPCQLTYWDCAIPKGLPPSPDRLSSDWNPNREYQAMLDYTYPLKPGLCAYAWDSSELQENSVLQTDLQDSGIDLEHLCSSTNLSGLDFSVSSIAESKDRSPLGAGDGSPDLPSVTRSTDDMASSTPLSLKAPVGLSPDGNKRGGRNHDGGVGRLHQNNFLTSHSDIFASIAYNCSTSVLPLSRCLDREMDEEFWPLPGKLEDPQLLSKQVREVMVRLSQPVGEPLTTSILSSIIVLDKREAEELTHDVACAKHTATPRTCGASGEPAGERPSLREVEQLTEQLYGLTLAYSQRRRPEERQQSDSLLRHIQVFCSHLEQLIQQLYTVSEKMELLSAASVDIDSVRSRLTEYQSFQREVSSHQPLMSRVLQTGQLLLDCMDTMSPLLSDALLLIEQQSKALQTHTEHLLSSILSSPDPAQAALDSGEVLR